MIMLNLLAVLSPEETKTVGIVAVMVAAVLGALLYPIARAYARRLEGSTPSPALREELAEISARLDSLQHGQERMAELEGRLDFAERLLAQQRERDPARLPNP
jgi:hypothetical protein